MDLVKQLPQELVIHLILSRLDYTSWVRAACVCRAWRDLFRQVVPPPPEIPWLWLSDSEYNHSLLSLPSTVASPHHPCPLVHGVWVGNAKASYRQYLLCVDPSPSLVPPCNIIIYNPFTGNTLPLPPPPRQMPPLTLAALTCLRLDSSSFVFVAAIANVLGSVHICGIGSDKWTRIKNIEPLNDLIFHGGLLYCVSSHGIITSMDVFNHPTKKSSRIAVPMEQNTPYVYINGMPFPEFVYFLVESCRKELLIVTRYNYARKSPGCPWFTVHRVDEVVKTLVQVNDLGDQMLFLRRGCSRSTWYGNSHAWRSDFFTKNSIYFYCRDERSTHLYLGKCSLDESGSWNSIVLHRDQLPIVNPPILITHVPRYS